MDEDEIGDHIEDHKREKLHREDKLAKGKRHLPSVHLERITIQWKTDVWLKNWSWGVFLGASLITSLPCASTDTVS